MIIIFTGVPGTGKTTLAREISKIFNAEYLDVNELVGKYQLGEYDFVMKTYDVDVRKLVNVLIRIIKAKDNLVIDSHLSHYIPFKYVDLCVVCTSNLKVLKSRLIERGYSGVKIRDNMDSEIFSSCLADSHEFGHSVVEIDTSADTIARSLSKILTKLETLPQGL